MKQNLVPSPLGYGGGGGTFVGISKMGYISNGICFFVVVLLGAITTLSPLCLRRQALPSTQREEGLRERQGRGSDN
jgi:hypothetical protein